MFDKLEKHHIGFIVPVSEKTKIEKRWSKQFHFDAIQQTHVLFVYDDFLRMYTEYICQEGRVSKQPAGFYHICYTVAQKNLNQVEDFINKKKLGFRLTELEKSGSVECEHIVFYFIKNMGVVELNVV